MHTSYRPLELSYGRIQCRRQYNERGWKKEKKEKRSIKFFLVLDKRNIFSGIRISHFNFSCKNAKLINAVRVRIFMCNKDVVDYTREDGGGQYKGTVRETTLITSLTYL